jgi:formyltetrahydrofolate deformylase
MTHPEYILTLSCLDQRGIVLRVAGFLAEHGCNIIDSAQFGDPESQLFFMRVHFALEDAKVPDADLRAAFAALCEANAMRGQLHDAGPSRAC